MGTDGGRFDVSDRLTADRLNRKTVLVDTGAGIAALPATPGTIAFCTSTGSGFAAGDLYERDESNTFWRRIFEAAVFDVFGDGSDGVLNVSSGTVTLGSDKQYRAVHVELGATLDTAGYTLKTRYLRNEGTITDSVTGGAGGAGGIVGNAQAGGLGGAGGAPSAGGGYGGGGGGGGADGNDVDATFIETGPNTGVFVADDIDVGDIDDQADGVDDGDSGNIDDGEDINFEYTDLLDDDDNDIDITVEIPDAGIDVDRNTVPVPTSAAGEEVTIVLSVVDPTANTNPGSVETVDILVADMATRDGDGESTTGVTAAGLTDIEELTGILADFTLTETGPNTGIFEATVQFEPRDADVDGTATAGGGTDDVTYTVLPGDVIAFRYEDEANTGGSSQIVSIVIEITSVDPTMSTTEETVQVGGTIALSIDDADANRDADSLDSVDVDITSDSDPVGFTLAALETGENTGIFTVNVPTSQTVSSGSVTVETGDDVMLEYNDEFPADYADRVETVLDPSKDFVLVVPVGQQASDTTATTPEAPVLKDISGEEMTRSP